MLAGLAVPQAAQDRILTGHGCNEDAAIVRVPQGKALVQTLDFLTPMVNDPYHFGRIAAANALSDVYAMGGQPWTAMNIACFPACAFPLETLRAILQGGADALAEAGAALAGGHTVRDEELKYGLSVTGLIDAGFFAANTGLIPGHRLILTKPLGTGILSLAVKTKWDGHEACERELIRCCGRLNASGGALIQRLRLRAATDITGFGLGGHALEMARASKVRVRLHVSELPILPRALELADCGLLPEGSHANRNHASLLTGVAPGVNPLLVDLAFDAQTSGGLLLAVPPAQVAEAQSFLTDAGDLARVVGEVLPDGDGPRLLLE